MTVEKERLRGEIGKLIQDIRDCNARCDRFLHRHGAPKMTETDKEKASRRLLDEAEEYEREREEAEGA